MIASLMATLAPLPFACDRLCMMASDILVGGDDKKLGVSLL